jgi:hypothetical protein
MLNTERNTPTMGARVLRAFRKWHKTNRPTVPNRTGLDTFFEHGQWFAQELTTGAQWSVNDAEGTEANGVFDGFCFEQVSRGEDD